MYERLAELDLDWPAWHVWWSDERVVPPDHPDSNERMAREALLGRVAIPEEQIHPLRSADVPLPERFDLILLGIGPDGHTASLFPGDPALEATEPVVYVPKPGLPPPHPRLTFTYPVLNAAEAVAFLAGRGQARDRGARAGRRRDAAGGAGAGEGDGRCWLARTLETVNLRARARTNCGSLHVMPCIVPGIDVSIPRTR